MTDKKSFLMYKSWAPIFAELNEADAGALIKMIFSYQTEEGYEPEGSSILKAIFSMMRMQLDENDERYEEIVKVRSEAGKKGGRPKKEQPETAQNEESNEKQMKANAFLKKQKKLIGREGKGREGKSRDEMGKEEVGGEGEGPEGEEPMNPPTDPPAFPRELSLVLDDGSDWAPDPDYYAQLKTAYADIDVDAELRKMRTACLADPKKRRSKEHVAAFVQKWLRNAEKDKTEQPAQPRAPAKGFDGFEHRPYNDDFYAAIERAAAIGG